MRREGMTIMDAAREWVSEMNAIPYAVLDKLMQHCGYEEVNEITPASKYDKVYICDGEHDGEHGEIVETCYDGDEDLYRIELDSSDEDVVLSTDEFEVQREWGLPMWGTLWSFGDSIDDYWLEEKGGLQKMADCGFRIYEQEDYGYVFGIDGAGYDFYEDHWIPLYKARGLKWHDPNAEKEYQMKRKGYVKKHLGNKEYWFNGDEIVEEV